MNRRDFMKGALGSGVLLLGSRIEPNANREVPSSTDIGYDSASVARLVGYRARRRRDDGEPRASTTFSAGCPMRTGRQGGLTYRDARGRPHTTFHIRAQINGCGFHDPDHSYDGGRVQYDERAGWTDFTPTPPTTRYAISYYGATDRPFMSNLALNYTTCDRYFCSILGPTYPNRIFQHGRTDRSPRQHDGAVFASDDLGPAQSAPGGRAGATTSAMCPSLALWGAKYLPISATYPQFLADAASGGLPNVGLRGPALRGREEAGRRATTILSPSIRAGDAFLSEIFHAVSGRVRGGGPHGPGRELRRVGRVLRARLPRAGSRRACPSGRAPRERHRHRRRPPRGGRSRASACRASWPLPCTTRRRPRDPVGRPRLLRPHLGAEDDRVALGAGPADTPTRHVARTAPIQRTSPRPSTPPTPSRSVLALPRAGPVRLRGLSRHRAGPQHPGDRHLDKTRAPAGTCGAIGTTAVGSDGATWAELRAVAQRGGGHDAGLGARRCAWQVLAVAVLGLVGVVGSNRFGAHPDLAAEGDGPPVRHVFVIVLENEGYAATFEDPGADPYLATTLPSEGALAPTDYDAIGHESNDNYIAMVSGQAPNPQTQADCQV